MKITKELYSELEKAIDSVFTGPVAPKEEFHKRYNAQGLSDMRFNWDCLYRSKFPIQKLYDAGLNDTHINTALAKILGNSGKSRKQEQKEKRKCQVNTILYR